MRILDPTKKLGYSSKGFRKRSLRGDELSLDPHSKLWVGDMEAQIKAVTEQLDRQIPEQEILNGLMAYEGLPEDTSRAIIEKAKGMGAPAESEFGIDQPVIQRPWEE